jgi:hypothetical protein
VGENAGGHPSDALILETIKANGLVSHISFHSSSTMKAFFCAL